MLVPSASETEIGRIHTIGEVNWRPPLKRTIRHHAVTSLTRYSVVALQGKANWEVSYVLNPHADRRALPRHKEVEFVVILPAESPDQRREVRLIAVDASSAAAAFHDSDEPLLAAAQYAEFRIGEDEFRVRMSPLALSRRDGLPAKLIVTYNVQPELIRRFMLSPASGMLMDAATDFESKRPGDGPGGRAAFQLNSGIAVKQFLTIWEMFDHRQELRRCTNELVRMARELIERLHYTKVATCTATARELANYVLDEVRTQHVPQLGAIHFDDDPVRTNGVPLGQSLFDDRVLILTDIVSTGSLVRNMAEQILRLGGTPIAALAVALTNRSLIEEQEATSRPPVIWRHERKICHLHAITTYPIDSVAEEHYDRDKLIPIDYASVLPLYQRLSKENANAGDSYRPKFAVPQFISWAAEARALDFALYEADERRFTITFGLRALLERRGDEIWRKIRSPLIRAGNSQSGNGLMLVSTYKQNDLLFKDFIQDRLAAEGHPTQTVVTLKRGVRDSTYLNLTLGERRSEIDGRSVVLVLGSLTSSEKLRSIVSLLLERNVRKLVVVCLLNRMGPYTTSFVSAIARFTRKTMFKDRATRQTPTAFEFHMVFSFLDLPGDNLRKAQAHIENDIAVFKAGTRSPAFQRLADRMLSYFSPTAVPRVAHPHEEPRRLSNPGIRGNGFVSDLTSKERIAELTYRLALEHDHRPVFDMLLQAGDRKTLFHMLTLILSDVEHLHFNGSLAQLYRGIMLRISELRRRRFSLERELRSRSALAALATELHKLMDIEFYLMFALGVVALHGSWGELADETSIHDLLFCGKDFDEWREYPNNMWFYFRDERAFFSVSYLLYALFPGFATANDPATKERRGELSQLADRFCLALGAYVDSTAIRENRETLQTSAAEVRSNFEALLTEAGKFDRRDNHQIVRFLHREVLKPAGRHSPIVTNMTRLLEKTERLLEEREPPHRTISVAADPELMSFIDSALSALAPLPSISSALRALFFFTPRSQQPFARYISPMQFPGLAADAQMLTLRLSAMRSSRGVSQEDHALIGELNGRIYDDLVDKELMDVLRSYIVDLRSMLNAAIPEARARLEKEGLRGLIDDLSGPVASGDEDGSVLVLCDRLVLQETIRNLLFNLRYSFSDLPSEERSHVPVKITLVPRDDTIDGETGVAKGHLLSMRVSAVNQQIRRNIERPSTTIAAQLARLREFGVRWCLNEGPDHHEFSLWFIDRGEVSKS